jgi:hypothetical protein
MVTSAWIICRENWNSLNSWQSWCCYWKHIADTCDLVRWTHWIVRSIARSIAWWIVRWVTCWVVRSIAHWIVRSIARSIACWVTRGIVHRIVHLIARSIVRSITRCVVCWSWPWGFGSCRCESCLELGLRFRRHMWPMSDMNDFWCLGVTNEWVLWSECEDSSPLVKEKGGNEKQVLVLGF